MSLSNSTFLTSSHKPMHRFASNSMWIFLRWTPTLFVKHYVGFFCNFLPILKNLLQNH